MNNITWTESNSASNQIMKKIAVGLFACCALLQAGAEELQWLTDLPKAQAQAKKENKLVMLDFTGSDWCGWCIRLNKEVFSKPEFAEYAKKNLVLVEVDFPRNKKQTEAQKEANQALQKQYKIDSYPTLIVLNPEGRQVATLSYDDAVEKPGPLKASPKPFIAKLEELKKKST
jgi:thioredoxin-related protein